MYSFIRVYITYVKINAVKSSVQYTKDDLAIWRVRVNRVERTIV